MFFKFSLIWVGLTDDLWWWNICYFNVSMFLSFSIPKFSVNIMIASITFIWSNPDSQWWKQSHYRKFTMCISYYIIWYYIIWYYMILHHIIPYYIEDIRNNISMLNHRNPWIFDFKILKFISKLNLSMFKWFTYFLFIWELIYKDTKM